MKVSELLDILSETFNLDDKVIIEMNGKDFKIDDVYKDGKGDVCIYSGTEVSEY